MSTTKRPIKYVAPDKFAPVDVTDNGMFWITPEVLDGIKEIFNSYKSAFSLLQCTANGNSELSIHSGFILLFLANGDDDLPIFEPLMAEMTKEIEAYLRTKYEGEVPESFEFSYEVDNEKGYSFKTLCSSYWFVVGEENRPFA